MITEEQIQQVLNVEHFATASDGGTKTFKLVGEDIGIVLYSTNTAKWITDDYRRLVEVTFVKGQKIDGIIEAKQWRYSAKMNNIEELLEIIKIGKSLIDG